MKKVYVGCSLTKAPESFRQFVVDFKRQLAAGGSVEVLEFVGLVNGTASEVYQVNLINNVKGCDALIAIVDEPSIGLGMEIQYATDLHKPILCLCAKGTKVTRMVHGAHELGHVTLKEYGSPEEALAIASDFLSAMKTVS